MAKKLRNSRTFWVNLIALGAIIVQTMTGVSISAQEQAAILAVINIALRIITKESIEGL